MPVNGWMHNDNVIRIYNGMLVSNKDNECCRRTEDPGKLGSEAQMLHGLCLMTSLDYNFIHCIYVGKSVERQED